MRTEDRLVENKIKVYVAMDGKEFTSEEECKDYEYNLQRKEVIEKAETMRIKELEGFLPLDISGNMASEWCHSWFACNSRKDLVTLYDAYGDGIDGFMPDAFPCIICIESELAHDRYYGEGYVFSMEYMLHCNMQFWEKFGFEMELRKKVQ